MAKVSITERAQTFSCTSYRPLVGPTETQGSCTAATTKSQEAHVCYSSEWCVRPFHNSIFIDTFYQWVHSTLL